jgi:amidase
VRDPNRSAVDAVRWSFERYEEADPLINSICTVNPHALDDAAQLDEESRAGRSRGPLHGVPIVVKDNVDTADLPTTAGSLALTGSPPFNDAAIVSAIREAGMVIVGKANLTEWANIRDVESTSGWSAYGGLTRNPYGLNRSAGGSSSGSGAAVAAGIVSVAVGTETDGSIVCPAAVNGCVGLKPTVGLVPGRGIVPISRSQDTAGPITTTVTEAAALLTVLASAESAGTPRTPDARRPVGLDYAATAVDPSLAGKRIGVPRQHYWGYSSAADAVAESALTALSAAGATIVDDTNLEPGVEALDDAELVVMLAEFRVGLEAYLAERPGDVPRSLTDVVEFNRAHADEELRYFGQGLFERALEGPGVESRQYQEARNACLQAARDDGIDRVLERHDLDALVSPTYGPAWPIDLVNAESPAGGCSSPAAMAGYPLLTVPVDLVGGLPVSVCFWGTAWSEPTLIEIAGAYEQLRNASIGPLPAPTFPSFV